MLNIKIFTLAISVSKEAKKKKKNHQPFRGFGIGTVLQGGPEGSERSIGSTMLLGAEGADTVPSPSLSDIELKGR